MPFSLQTREFFVFELRQQLRHPGFCLLILACIVAGVGFTATDMGLLEVAVGRVDRNVPYAVVTSLAALSAVGMIVVLVSVGQAALRDFSTGAGPLIFSCPVRSSAYLAGRFLGGYVAAMIALAGGVIAMAVTQVLLKGSDPELGPISWLSFAYGVTAFLVPNVLLVGAMIFLLAIWSRSMGATFLGLLAVIVCQDLAEVLPVSTFGYRIPALLDPLGLAALKSATHTWTVKEYAESMPPMTGDLLLNRGLWLLATMVSLGLAGSVFALKTRRADLGQKPRRRGWLRRRLNADRQIDQADNQAAPTMARLPVVHPNTGAAVHRKQFLAILRFELSRIVGTLTFKVILISGLALALYSVSIGERVVGVRSIPGVRTIAISVERASRLTVTLMIVLFSAEVVWRERSTRMDLTIDSFPTTNGVTVAGKMAAVALLLVGTLVLFAAAAWGLQASQSTSPAAPMHVAAAAIHASLGPLQIAAAALLLQTLAGGRMAGYAAVGIFLALRIALGVMGFRSDLVAFAGAKLPVFSDMDHWGHTWPRLLLVQLYWTSVAASLALMAMLLWPRGVILGMGERLARGRRRLSRGALAALAISLSVSVGGGVALRRTITAEGMGWDRDKLEAFQADFEKGFHGWRGRPRPEVITLQADVDLDAEGRRVRVRGRYGLLNRHTEAIEEMLLCYDPDMQLLGLGFGAAAAESGAKFAERVWGARASKQTFPASILPGATSSKGTHIVRFDPPLVPGQSIRLDFDLEFDPPGLGARPADLWLRRNGAFLVCGPGSHPAFRGAQVFPTLGYDQSRELHDTRARARQGLEPWQGLSTPEAYERARQGSAAGAARQLGFGGSDWAQVELWIHTDQDQQVLAPGELVSHSLEGDQAHYQFRTQKEISAFFPIVSGRYEKTVAKAGEVELEVYAHPGHSARVAHIIWAMQRSLAYFEEHWGPCPTRVLRMGEIPSFEQLACSFPGGMMAFTESMAFTLPRGEGQPIEFPGRHSAEASSADVDPILWIVAHEVAHQWWDCHVLPAQALGSTFASESLAQYGSLCVVQEEYGDDMALRLAEYNHHTYLSGRSRANRKERPLVHVDEQAHLHYGKGFLAFHSLVKIAGREPIDRALARIVEEHGGQAGTPITSLNVIDALSQELPPALASHLRELLEEISFLETSVKRAHATALDGERYGLEVECLVQALRTDGDGEEFPFDYSGPLELEVMFEDGDETVLLGATVEAGRAHFEGNFERLPTSVRVDPRLLHIDRDLSDNQSTVKEIAR